MLELQVCRMEKKPIGFRNKFIEGLEHLHQKGLLNCAGPASDLQDRDLFAATMHLAEADQTRGSCTGHQTEKDVRRAGERRILTSTP